MTTSWIDNVVSQILDADDGEYMIGTSDQRGDGYDIAVAPHTNDLDALADALRPHKITVTGVYASGALCGYCIRKYTSGLKTIRNCQHPGNWGPWYHLSLYERDAIGKPWRFVAELGRSGRGDGNFGFGRPAREDMR